MFTSLRWRLWLSYAFLIGTVLGILATALIAFLLFSPTIERATFQRLDIASATVGRLLLRAETNPRTIPTERLQEALGRADELVDARILILQGGQIIADSRSDQAPAVSSTDTVQIERPRGVLRDNAGNFWLYQARALDGFAVMVMTPRPRRLPGVLYLFSDELLSPFALAGAVALLLALILAWLMARWISAPLNRMADAAHGVSQGKYDTIRLEGPREVKELAASFNEMTRRVDASRKSQRDFVANVSHELKTPLTSIQGFAQAILDGTVVGRDALQQAAEVIYAEASRMHRLVIDLLDLARIDAGTLEFSRTTVDLVRMLQLVADKFVPQANQSQVALVTEMESLPEIIGDRDRLAQVFTNLVDNALKYTPAHGQVRILAHRINSDVEIRITDTGPGIPPEELPRIFERFYQLDKSRRGGRGRGVGLGLAIAHEIVQAHNGHLRVESQFGAGSAFIVSLPIVRPDDTTLAARRRSKSSQETIARGR